MANVLIIGAGIAGLTAAAALGQRSWNVDLIERKPQVDDGGGIGLSIVANAMSALDRIGVADDCVAAGVPADVIKMLKPDGSLLVDNPLPRIGGPKWPGATGISRKTFHGILVAAAKPHSNIRCGLTVEEFDGKDDSVDVRFSDGSSASYDLVVAADGINSQMRKALMPGIEPEPTGQACWRAAIPRPDDLDCTQISLGGDYGVVGICPVSEDLAYMYIVETDDGNWRDNATLDLQFREKLANYGGLVARCVDLVADPAKVNFSALPGLIAPKPWGMGRIIMIGDAVHANPPVIAQGAAMGIEDAVVLADCLDDGTSDIDHALGQFIERRYERAKDVVDTSCQLARWEVEQRHDVNVAQVMRESSERLARPI